MSNHPRTDRPPLYRAVPVVDVLPAEAPPPAPPVKPPPLPVFPLADVQSVGPPPLPVVVRPDERPSTAALPGPRERPGLLRRAFRLLVGIVFGIGSVVEWLFGVAALMGGLAVLAALPVLQFLSLGYLLEAGGRVARSGRLRDGFIGVPLVARLGGVVAASWLLLLPVRVVSGLARSAEVIDPGGPAADRWRVGLLVLMTLTALHLVAACVRGGRFRHFLWPFNLFWLVRRLLRGGYYAEARDAVWDVAVSLRLPYYFWLGFRGFVGAAAWLVVPVSLLALGRLPAPGGVLLGWLGALLLGVVLLYLPFLQMRLAQTGRLSAAFEVRAVRADFRRAPWLFALALVITLLSALPLYLLKIEMVPREAAWLPSLVFIAFIFPARLLTGWALARAERRQEPRHWLFRWTGRLPLVPAVAFYVLVIYFTQFTSWNGVWSLYEQHAFLVPVPFFGM